MKPRKNQGKIGTDTIFQTGYKREKWCLSLFCVVLTILIALQDVSYALSPPSRFRPIPDSEKQSNQPYAAPPQVETVPTASDVLKPQLPAIEGTLPVGDSGPAALPPAAKNGPSSSLYKDKLSIRSEE